jgi:hypothetical protein
MPLKRLTKGGYETHYYVYFLRNRMKHNKKHNKL